MSKIAPWMVKKRKARNEHRYKSLAIYLFNLIGDAPPLEKLGFSSDLLEILSSVHYETYRNCENEYE